jgi:hypothetical protein
VNRISRWASAGVAASMLAVFGMYPHFASAGTTGTITGTVRNAATGAPLAHVRVTGVSPSQTASTITDARGFYSLLSLIPDTYTVSFSLNGYSPASVPGVVVQQDLNVSVNERLTTALKVIATAHAAAAQSLVKPDQGSDVYNVSGSQLGAVTNPGGLEETLYQWTAAVPGITGTGFPSQPRVRGGQVTDLGYEFEGIPIEDRSVGFYTTTLSNIGVSNLEVYTGGLNAANAANGTGLLNSVLKTGTYPGFTHLAIDIAAPDYNHSLAFESGYATPDGRWSYYVGFSGANEDTTYACNCTYPGELFWGGDGPGPIFTRDLVGNFHYRPDKNDDIQVVATNGYGFFDYDYLINKLPDQPPVLQFEACDGATRNNYATMTDASGGVAPNGQTCPEGLYFAAMPNDKGNIWYQYAAVGKIQWNHNINDHSYFSLRIAENYGEYVFQQPIADANIPSLENFGTIGCPTATAAWCWNWATDLGLGSTACPSYPYAAGSPVPEPVGDPGAICAFDNGIANFYENRRSNMYFGNLDYQDIISDNITVKAGASDEKDQSLLRSYLTNQFNPVTGGWPALYEDATYPTNIQHGYGEADLRFGHWLLDPGLLYAQEHYAFPNGGHTVSVWNPTFNGTYQFGSRDVMRFSWGDTSSFIGSAYVYLTPDSLITRSPLQPGVSYNPQVNHNADLQWEHQFTASTSMRIGPWYSKTTNYYESYTPIVGHLANGAPLFSKVSILSNNQQHHDFGMEFALNHVDDNPVGLSYWVTATYDNYWTSSTALAGAFINSPEPQDLINQGHLLRAFANPLWNTSAVFDFHAGGFHLDPMVVYQADYFYYNQQPSCFFSGTCVINTNGAGFSYIAEPESISGADWTVNLQAYQDLGSQKNFFVGFKVDNLFNNTNDVAPCMSDGTGCPLTYDGPFSGVHDAPGTQIYQNYAEDPYIGALSVDSMQRLFEVYAGVRLAGVP